MSGAPPPYPGPGGKDPGYPPPGQPMGYGQPPPPAGYAQPYGQPGYPANQSTTVVISQPTFGVVQQFRESPISMTCPQCNADVVTATSYDSGTFTWIICLISCFVLSIFGCCWGCCLIPFCVDSCKDVIHTCPNCRQVLGRYKRM